MEGQDWYKRIGKRIEQDYKHETSRQNVIREAEIFNAILRQQERVIKDGNSQYSLSPFLKRKQESGIPLSDVEKDFVRTYQIKTSFGINPPFDGDNKDANSERP